ncbi:hypothetical protein [Spirillospora sp. CA-294931]|uniref:hypothetical protein n=1 Tax=Spirillospora sp. CA-294931 TaxID=3240042 RepID=UPI003D948C29
MTSPTAVAAEWARYRRAGRREGVVPALTLLCESAGALPCGPAGHAVVPGDLVGTFGSAWAAGRIAPRSAGLETVLETLPVEGGTVVAVKNAAEPPAGAGPAPVEAWALGLTWLRLGLSERIFDAAFAYLNGRTVGDAKLLQQQMIKGDVAEVLIEHLEIETLLDGAVPGELGHNTLADLNTQITRADRMGLRLLGASSFLQDGPGQVARVSELLADAYIGPAHDGEST